MAYAALLSLTQTLEQILGSRDEIRVFHDEKQIKSLHEKLSFLLSFLEDSSHKNTESITCLEARIRDATYEAEDIIELHMSKPILSDSAFQGVISCFWEIIYALQIMIPVFHNTERCVELEGHSFKEKYEDLQKVIKEIDSISEEVEKMMAMNEIEGSSADGLMQIKDPLSAIEGIEEMVKTKDVGDILDLQPRKSLRATSSKPSSVNKDAMVGFEHDLLQIKERLVGQSSRLKSAVTGNVDDFMEILSWSYNRLPHHLRACFLYMGVFPEDYVIHVSHLIRLWVAEGFIKPIAHNSLEEVAKQYLEELIDRNLIMVRHRVYGGEIKTCSMHDLMRELCVKKAEKEKFLYIANQKVEIPLEVMKNHRHLSIMKNHHRLSIHRPTFRSLLYFTDELLPNPLRFQLLRVLRASTICFHEFPIEIVKLVNLRYIALKGGMKFMIPIEISELRNLQTLIVFQSYDLERLFLPPELLKMPQLRHLLFDGGVLLCSHGPQNENLQTLSGVRDFRFTEEALQIFPNLKTLGITYRCRQTELSFYCLENLVLLHQLESFKCVVSSNRRKNVPLPQNLAFPPNLKKLTLSGCGISSNNMLVVGSLPNLEVLKLKEVAFESNAWKTKEGEFSRLKLLLVEAFCFEFWEAEAAHFPILECLCLRRCMKLECIPSGIGEIPTLQQIILYGCPPSVEISANSILQEQKDLANNDLVVHVYPKKVVLKLEYVNEKIKRKAMKTVACLSGVESIVLNAKDKEMTVIGDTDPVEVEAKLRMLCGTEIMPAKGKKK